MKYDSTAMLNEIGKRYKRFNHDLKVKEFTIHNDLYKEYIAQLTIKGVGKRTNREVIKITQNNLEAIKAIDGHVLLGCVESFGDELNIELSDDVMYKTESEKENELENKKEDSKKEVSKEKTNKKKEKDWENESLKQFKTEVVRLRGNMKKLGIEESKELNPYVQKFSDTKLNKQDKDLKSHDDVKPNNIKIFNTFLEKVIEKKKEKTKKGE